MMRLGQIAAPPEVTPAAFARALEGRVALVLAPSSERGWLGGKALVAWDPIDSAATDLRGAGAALGQAFDAAAPELAVALVTYEGAATVARFGGCLVLEREGWRIWGTPPADLRDVAEAAAASAPTDVPKSEPLLADAVWDLSGREFRAGVEAVRERIAAGDVYVLNLTGRLFGKPSRAPAECFGALVDRAGSEMSAWFGEAAGRWIASVSPERFLHVREDYGVRVVEVCPIKGTRPRGNSADSDDGLAAELLSDAKERSEHVMVVDMERNDLGRVCMPGTVRVDPLYEVVPTPYCHQLVSTVRGTLAEDAAIADLLEAAFPCGSVTGAPKIAAIGIAAELERSPRGAYCGSLLVAIPGELDSSVLIRTLESHGPGAAWGAGGGITYDSDPVAEHLEMLLKTTPVTGDAPPADALRETMRVAFGRVPLLGRHLTRLAVGGAGPTTLARVRDAVANVLAGLDASEPYARIGVTVTPDGEVAAGASEEPSTLAVEDGPVLHVVTTDEVPLLPLGAAKPASRRYWDKAHREARMAGADQAALATSDGVLIDGSTATIWLATDGRLVTPPSPPAVAGVAREVVFDLARSLGIPATEAPLTVPDLDTAEEVALSNAVGGFVPVRGRGGSVTDALVRAFEAHLRA